MSDDAPTDPQRACFEAGVKFGSLYHQFAGTPVSPTSAPSLETAIAEAIENQPHCESVAVDIDDERVREAIDHDNGYTELTGSLMDVRMRVRYEDVVVRTKMELQDGYPLMELVAVEQRPSGQDIARTAQDAGSDDPDPGTDDPDAGTDEPDERDADGNE